MASLARRGEWDSSVFQSEGESDLGLFPSGSSLNDMKDMLASLPQLQEAKQKVCVSFSFNLDFVAQYFRCYSSRCI